MKWLFLGLGVVSTGIAVNFAVTIGSYSGKGVDGGACGFAIAAGLCMVAAALCHGAEILAWARSGERGKREEAGP